MWLILSVLIVIQLMFSTSMTTWTPDDYSHATHTVQYGFGPSIEIVYNDAIQEAVRIHWMRLSLNLFLCYGLSAISASCILRITRLQRPFMVYGSLTAGILCVAFLVAIAVSKWYWGYMFDRPPVLKELHHIKHVIRIIPVKAEPRPEGTYDFVVNTDYVMLEDVMSAQRDDYYALDERMLFVLQDRNLLPETLSHRLAPYESLYHDVEKTGLLALAQPGYTSSGELRGILLVATTTTGAEYVFLGANGQQVENDHYPYYELVFEKQSDSDTLVFLQGQRFFYDVAGVEGFEWFALWGIFSLIGICLILPIVTVIIVFQRFFRNRNTRQKDVCIEMNA
jgi:hypothetical protein